MVKFEVMMKRMKILVTGGLGFIGSNFIVKIIKKYPTWKIINVDAKLIGSNKDNLKEIKNNENYLFVKGNIINQKLMDNLISKVDLVINFAAESHVDNSISSPIEFINTNIIGTYNILQCIVSSANQGKKTLFHHISTDEVFGSLDLNENSFTELSNFAPSSPYSASKASSDLLVEAWGRTFNINYIITNCSNNFGPRQYLEKLIPKTIINIINSKSIPLYGAGTNIRDWLFVEDHIDAILSLYNENLFINNRFNIGGGHEISNIEIIHAITNILDSNYGFKNSEKLIEFVEDRKGHDFRYSINSSKIESATNWKANKNFKQQLEKTIDWYVQNQNWWN